MGRLLNLVPAYCNFSPEKSALMFIFSHKAKCKPNSIGIVHSLENAKLVESYFTMARLGFGTYLRDGISNISVGKSGRCNEVECPPRVPLKNHGIDESQASYEGHHSPERLGQAAIALTSLIAHVLLLLCLQGTKLKNNINAMTKGFLPQKRSHKGSTNCLLFCQNNLTDMQDTQVHLCNWSKELFLGIDTKLQRTLFKLQSLGFEGHKHGHKKWNTATK